MDIRLRDTCATARRRRSRRRRRRRRKKGLCGEYRGD